MTATTDGPSATAPLPRPAAELGSVPRARRGLGRALRPTVLVLVAGLLLLEAAPAAAAFAFRKPLVIRGARVVGGAHANYPVLVSFVDANLRSVAFGGNVRSAGGFDIEFRANDQVTILDHELERYTPSTGEVVAWVRVPSLTNPTNVTILVYYGDPSVTCARNNPSRVWDPNYRYVYHLAQSGPANPTDSTVNAVPAARNPTADGGIVNAYTAAGWIGGALDLQSAPVVPVAGQFLPATPTHLRITDGALPASPAFTMEIWFRADTKVANAFHGLHTKGRDSNANWIGSYLLPQGVVNHRFGLGWNLPAGNVSAAPNLVTGQWYHGVVTSTGGALPTRTVYLDGAPIANSAVAAALPAINLPTRVGDDSNGTYLDGPVDEVRFSNAARSAAWIQTTFRNHRCPSLTVFPAGCLAGDHFVDDSGAPVAAGLPAFVNNTAASGLGLTGTKDGGLTWADWNGDTCPDVLVNTSSAALGSRLYLQARGANCAGVFTDVTACLAPGLTANTLERSAIWGDLNQDGRPDFARNTTGRIEIYLNNGAGTTTGGACPAGGVAWTRFGNPATGTPSQVIDGTVVAGLNSEGMGFIDYDEDGDLDLVADNGDNGALMFRNNGVGSLASVAGTGMPTSTPGNGDYLAVTDVDGDADVGILLRKAGGVPDFYTSGAGFYSPSALDVAASNANKGGAAFCDFDNDGDFDLLWTDAPATDVYERQAGGTYVLRPTGALFTGVDYDGVTCGDVDHDGDVDIVLAGGGNGVADRIFRNDGGFSFTDVTPAAFGGGDGEAITVSDYDRDGDLDVLVNQWDGTGATANQLWRNERNDRNYLMVRALVDRDGAGPELPRDALGATMTLRSCAGALRAGIREINGGEGHGSQGPLLAHFGLPTSGSPSGPNQVYVVRVVYVGGLVRQRAVVPGALGCYQQVTITSTDADDLAACTATAVELQSFEARSCDGAVDLRWSTASELDNLGFHVHRASHPEGPYSRVTEGLIPGLGSSPVGAAYRFLDAGLTNGAPLYYRLEDVETTGRTEWHGPVAATPQASAVCAGAEPGGDGGGGVPGGGEGGSDGPTGPRVRHGAPGEPELRVLRRGPGHVVLELRTPGFDAVPDDQGRMRLRLPGFEDLEDRGAASVPFRRAVVPAVPGRKVHLRVLAAEESLVVDGIRLSAAGPPELELGASGVVRLSPRRGRAPRAEPGYYPRHSARLLGSVFQGEAKKAELALQPLRYDDALGRVLLHRRLVVRLDFAGREAGETSLGGGRGLRPRGVPAARPRAVVAHLVTREEGLYRVTFEEVLSGRSVPVSGLRLSRRGVAVSYRIEPPRASFGPGSALYFLGGGDLNPHGEAVYELEVGRSGVVMETLSGAPSGGEVAEGLATRTFEENRFYQAALLEAGDLWLWDLVVSPNTKAFPFGLPGLRTASWRGARLRVRLQGASEMGAVDHHVRLLVNGTPVAEATWAGKTERLVEAELPAGVLRAGPGANTLTLHNVGDTGVPYSMFFLNRFEVDYPREAVADAGEWGGLADEAGTLRLAGFSGGSFVLDTTLAPVWLTGALPGLQGPEFRVESGRSYRVVSAAAVKRPLVRRPSPRAARLRAASNRADWLLVGPRALLPAAAELVELRRAQGLRAKTVALEDVFAHFGFGEADPQALRQFLSHVFSAWARPAPRYVLLLGDSSYDPKDHLRTGVRDVLPSPLVKTSALWAASDPSLAAVNGEDLVPDFAIGRLPAKNEAEARVMVQKIVAFERGGYDLSGEAVLVADNPDGGGNFEADAEAMAAGPLAGRAVRRVFVRELGASTRATIKDALDTGPAVVSYMGHGGTVVWASENVWNVQDVPALAPQARPPLLLTMNCMNGFFQFPSLDALGEAMVKGEARGAIAAFSPSGLSVNAAARVYQEAVLRELFRHDRVGDALLAAQAAYQDAGAFPELLSIYHLFGDPALRVRP